MAQNQTTPHPLKSQTVWVFQQDNSALGKIQGIRRYSHDDIKLKIITIERALPLVIDDPVRHLPPEILADLVLDYLRHPDLSHALARICRRKGIPMIASGKKGPLEGALTPVTCCALAEQEGLGAYGRRFGLPQYGVVIDQERIVDVQTLRGAPCGATWQAAQRIAGLTVEAAKTRIGLECQYACVADPGSWDPISGRSPVHIAGELHKAALTRALKNQPT